MAEATDLKSVQCRFESDWGYGGLPRKNRINASFSNVVLPPVGPLHVCVCVWVACARHGLPKVGVHQHLEVVFRALVDVGRLVELAGIEPASDNLFEALLRVQPTC